MEIKRRVPTTTSEAAAVKRSIERDEPDEEKEDYLNCKSVSTGSTLLNLAFTDDPERGYLFGFYYFCVGDSTSGKTWQAMSCMAEASLRPDLNNVDFFFDNVEDGALMDVERFFGKRAAARIKAPKYNAEGAPVFSDTIEDFYFTMDDLLEKSKKSKRPFIYVLDSMDALSSADEQKYFDKIKKASEDDGKAKGSFGDGKAKKNSAFIRRVINGLRETGSLLIIICQTRDNLDQFSFEKKIRSGGRSLRFYATVEWWSSITGQIKKTVRSTERKIGHTIQLQLKKNRITGKLQMIEIPIYPSYGIDDTASMIDFLIDDGWWSKGGKGRKRGEAAAEGETGGSGIVAKELTGDDPISRDKLIQTIEEDEGGDYRRKLIKTVKKAWDRIQEENALKRPSRYQ